MPFLLKLHFVCSWFGITMRVPGCNGNYCSSVAFSCTIRLVSRTVNVCTYSCCPLAGSSFAWTLTWSFLRWNSSFRFWDLPINRCFALALVGRSVNLRLVTICYCDEVVALWWFRLRVRSSLVDWMVVWLLGGGLLWQLFCDSVRGRVVWPSFETDWED